MHAPKQRITPTQTNPSTRDTNQLHSHAYTRCKASTMKRLTDGTEPSLAKKLARKRRGRYIRDPPPANVQKGSFACSARTSWMGRASPLPIIACPSRTSSALRGSLSTVSTCEQSDDISLRVRGPCIPLYKQHYSHRHRNLVFHCTFALDFPHLLYLELAAELGCLRHFPSCFQKPTCFLALTLRI